MGSITFYAKQINHGQSDIWLGDDGKELTPKRRLATNEVVNADAAFARHYGCNLWVIPEFLRPAEHRAEELTK